MSDQYFNPEMLILAREYQGLTQKELADVTEMQQSVISRLERDELPFRKLHAQLFSKALNIPITFFCQEEERYGLGSSFLFHRKRKKMSAGEFKLLEATVNITRIRVKLLLEGITTEHEYDLPRLAVDVNRSPEDIAHMIRASWRLPSGPIKNLTSAIERTGGIVVRIPFDSDRFDGVVSWVGGLPPFFVLNQSMPADRDRWTLAHEIAHAVMHNSVHGEIETEADRFAAELLMPEDDIEPELRTLSLAKAAQMKLNWRVSIQAIVRRARDLGTITDRRYRYLMYQLGNAGYRKHEPNSFQKESAKNLDAIIRVHEQSHKLGLAELGDLTHTNPEEFRRLYTPQQAHLRLAT